MASVHLDPAPLEWTSGAPEAVESITVPDVEEPR